MTITITTNLANTRLTGPWALDPHPVDLNGDGSINGDGTTDGLDFAMLDCDGATIHNAPSDPRGQSRW